MPPQKIKKVKKIDGKKFTSSPSDVFGSKKTAQKIAEKKRTTEVNIRIVSERVDGKEYFRIYQHEKKLVLKGMKIIKESYVRPDRVTMNGVVFKFYRKGKVTSPEIHVKQPDLTKKGLKYITRSDPRNKKIRYTYVVDNKYYIKHAKLEKSKRKK
jgi:hypothetical protein